ncbi:MAG: hypothetical protein LBG19_08195 [Prevotellaceae bacterium]|jgi:hypothetical protein|nr:hypothetical protein [Prevotellaceae bacterium]
MSKFKVPKFVKYIRALSIVIVGVLITLSITSYISRKAKEKEVKELMTLIKIELQENLESIERVQQKYETEQRVFALIRQQIDNLEKIPADTLKQHRNILGGIHRVLSEKDSYEVFKSSLLMPYVKDKNFLRRLAKTYREIETISDQLERYTTMKANGANEMVENMTEKDLQLWENGTIYDYFRIPLSHKTYRSFVFIGGTILAADIFEYTKQVISSMIKEIDEQRF